MNAAPWLLSIRGEKLCCSCRLAFGLNVAQFEFETLGVSIPAISFSARTEAVVAFSSSECFFFLLVKDILEFRVSVNQAVM